MNIEEYIRRRKEGQSMDFIIDKSIVSTEDTIWVLELGYQCHLKGIRLDDAIDLIQAK